jgi:hypothetical protein
MSFYKFVESAVAEVDKDIALQLIQGPFTLYPFHPFRSDPSSVVVRLKDGVIAYRKCTDAGASAAPDFLGENISRNGGEFLGEHGHPSLHECDFPTPLDLAHNLAVTCTLWDMVRAHWGEPSPSHTPFGFTPDSGFLRRQPFRFHPRMRGR